MTNFLYHNPKCSKSRAAIELLNAQGIKYKVKEYLKTGLTREEVQSLLRKLVLNTPLDGLMRVKEMPEVDFEGLSKDELVALLIAHPFLLERPIFETPVTAVIARPTKVLADFLAI